MAKVQARVEAALERFLPSAEIAPQRLHDAMRYAGLGGGKRIRPLLAFAAGGGARGGAARAAGARAGTPPRSGACTLPSPARPGVLPGTGSGRHRRPPAPCAGGFAA